MDSFEQELLAMEREVRALKTSHEIALGSLNFYEKDKQVTTPSGLITPIYIRLTNKVGEPTYSFAQIYIVKSNGSANYDWNGSFSYVNDGQILQYYYPVKAGTTYLVKAINTADFDLIVKNFENSDWLED